MKDPAKTTASTSPLRVQSRWRTTDRESIFGRSMRRLLVAVLFVAGVAHIVTANAADDITVQRPFTPKIWTAVRSLKTIRHRTGKTNIPPIVASPIRGGDAGSSNLARRDEQPTGRVRAAFKTSANRFVDQAGYVMLRSLEDQLKDDEDSAEDGEDEADDSNPDSSADDARSKQRLRLVPLSALFKPVTAIDVATAMSPVSPDNSLLTTPDNTASAYAQPMTVEQRLPGRFGLQQLQNYASRRPLYFEEARKERLGEGQGCCTTAVSATKFFATTIALPFKMIATPPSTLVPMTSELMR